MRRRIGTVMATLVLAAAGTVVGAGTAGASACIIKYGIIQDSGANFYQEVSLEICPGPSGGTVKVGVYMKPFGQYFAPHVTGCSAHLELTDTTIGSSTRSDRPVNCTAIAHDVFINERVPIGPSSWTGQNINDDFRARAWINIQTGPTTEYMTIGQASQCDWPFGDALGRNCYSTI
jgi:hypothetical protein